MPNTSNDYTDFDNVDSGENGTIEGLLPIEGGASSFRYRKQIFVTVLGADPGSFTQPITGTWKVRLRENANRSAQNPGEGLGPYIGKINFEQEIEWTADVIAFGLGGIDFITWSPRGPAGSGIQRTSICNSEECATIQNINNPQGDELLNYGLTGAWRFLDNPTNTTNSTPGQKYDIERGFVAPETFDPEGGFTIGGFIFTCEWQSASYLCDGLEEGAILETVEDHWQTGTLDTEAFYRFSYVPGSPPGFETLRDPRAGITLSFSSETALIICAQTRRRNPFGKDADTIVYADKSPRFKAFQTDATIYLVFEDKNHNIYLTHSQTWGRSWETPQTMVNDVTLLSTCPSADRGTIYILGISNIDDPENQIAEGDLIRVIISQSRDSNDPTIKNLKTRVKSKISGTVPTPKQAVGTLDLNGSTFTWSYRDDNKNVVLLTSTDECATWQQFQNIAD